MLKKEVEKRLSTWVWVIILAAVLILISLIYNKSVVNEEIAKQENIIIDSQLSGFLLKDIADFKIHLVCPIDIRVKRMAARDQTSYKTKLKETTLREK